MVRRYDDVEDQSCLVLGAYDNLPGISDGDCLGQWGVGWESGLDWIGPGADLL